MELLGTTTSKTPNAPDWATAANTEPNNPEQRRRRRSRRRLLPQDNIAKFIQDEHEAGVQKVSFTLVGKRQDDQQQSSDGIADITTSNNPFINEDTSSSQAE